MRFRFSMIAPVGLSCLALPAYSAEVQRSDGYVEEVIVTAQKREERLIDVPQGVSVLSADALAEMGAVRFRDFASTVPGLTHSSTGAGSSRITLRGVSAGLDTNPLVGTYVDEVPYGPSTVTGQGGLNSIDVGVFDLERIEVLKGPQGTLYGASAMSGLVKYVTKAPDTSEFGVDVKMGLSASENGGLNSNVSTILNAPLVAGKAGLRLTGYYSDESGYIEEVSRNVDDINSANIYGGRVDLLLTPTDALSIRINALAQNITRDGDATVDYSLTTGNEIYGDLTQRRFPEPFFNHFRLASATVNYDLDWAAITAVSAYQTNKWETNTDISIRAPSYSVLAGRPYVGITFPSLMDFDKFTQELRLASSGEDFIEWQVGGFYNREAGDRYQRYIGYNAAGVADPASPSLLLYNVNPVRYTEYAAFGDVTVRLSAKFDVTAGLRYADYESTLAQSGVGALGTSFPEVSSTESVTTYLANARYHVNDRATAYVRYATGYRPGSPNNRILDVQGNPVGPAAVVSDTLKSYEAGFKGETASGIFAIDAAIYYIDWKDLQISVPAGGFQVPGNGGSASVTGAELVLTMRPVDEFTLTGAFAYQDPQLEEDVLSLRASKGERLPNSPHFTGVLDGDYEFAAVSFTPKVGASVRYRSDQMTSFDRSATPQYRLPPFTTVDLRASMDFGTVEAQFFLRNLLDERGQQAGYFTQYGSARVAVLEPRTVGVTATMRF